MKYIHSLLIGSLATASMFAGASPAAAAPPGGYGEPVRISQLPYVIDSCGTYILTADLFGASGQHGITINTNDVVLDLNGFTIAGVPGSLDGVHSTANWITVRNGTVRAWSDGISIEGEGCRVERVFALNNGFAGISLGQQGVVERCYAQGQNGVAGVGIRTSADGRIERCVVVENRNGLGGQAGGGTVRSCVAVSNSNYGISAGTTTEGWSYIGNASGFNDVSGFFMRGRSMVMHNNATNNGTGASDAGIELLNADSFVSGNLLFANEIGLQANIGGDHVIARNVALANTSNYTIAVGNDMGTVVGSILVADPWDNLSR